MTRVTPTVVGYAVADATSANGVTFNKSDLPTMADGDYLVGFLRCSTSSTSTDYSCTGFARLNDTITVDSSGRLIGVYGKAVPTASSEPSTYAFAFTGTAGRNTGILLLCRNVDTSSPVSGYSPVGNSPTYYSGGAGYTTTVGSLTLVAAANETVSPNASSPTADSDYTTVADHPSTTGTAATRSCIWVGSRTADSTTAPAYTGTTWASTSSLAYWGVSLQGIDIVGVPVKIGSGVAAHMAYYDGSTRHTPSTAKLYLPGFPNVTAALAKFGATMGHRGASGVADMPEMSERAYDYSVMRGYGILEFSTNRTSDAVWIGCHDADLNRTSETSGLPLISSQTYATVLTHTNTLNSGGIGRVYYRLIDFLDKYTPHHVVFVDPKAASGFITDFLDTLDAHGGPTKIVVKVLGNSSNSAALSDAAILRGYSTWGYFYESDGETAINTYASRYTILGLDYTASATAWAWINSYGKLVVGHVCPSQAAYNTAVAAGADLVQCSRPDLITPVSPVSSGSGPSVPTIPARMKSFWAGNSAAPSTSAVNYDFLNSTLLSTWNATESTRQQPISEDITITKLSVWCTTAPASGKNFVYTIRDDAADTLASVTIADTATSGSWTGTVSIAALSMVTLAATPTGTPTSPTNVWWTIEYKTNGQYYLLLGGNGSAVSTAATNYIPPTGGQSVTAATVVTDWEQLIPAGVTVTKLVTALDVALASGKTMAVSLRQNDTTDVLTATVTGNGTITQATATGSVSLSAGDAIVMKTVPGSTPASSRVRTCLTVVPSTTGEVISCYGSTVGPATSGSTYQQFFGAGNSSFSTENVRQNRVNAHTLKKFFVKLFTAPGSGKSWAFTVRDNTAGTTLTCTIADTATTGNDTAHTVTVADGDLLAVQATATATPTATGGVKYGMVHVVAQP